MSPIIGCNKHSLYDNQDRVIVHKNENHRTISFMLEDAEAQKILNSICCKSDHQPLQLYRCKKVDNPRIYCGLCFPPHKMRLSLFAKKQWVCCNKQHLIEFCTAESNKIDQSLVKFIHSYYYVDIRNRSGWPALNCMSTSSAGCTVEELSKNSGKQTVSIPINKERN